MSDVLPSNNQEALPPVPNVPPPPQTQAAIGIARLRKRMDCYRDLQASRLPNYEQTMNHVNSQQSQETLVLRQKFHESNKQKNQKKKNSSVNSASSGDKMKHDMGPAGPGPMNGMMGFHGGPGGPHTGPHMGPGPNMNGPPMGMNGPASHNGPLGHQNGPTSMMGHGPNNGATHNKRPLDDDSSNIQSDTAKRLNLDNGNISDQNFIKREPSPHETKFNPGAGFGGNGGQQPQPRGHEVKPPGVGGQPQPTPLPDVKPNVNSLKQEITDSAQTKNTENSDNKYELKKSEVSDSVKQEDTLGDLDLNLDIDFEGLGDNDDALNDLIGDIGNFDNFEFDNSKIDDKDNGNLSNASENGGLPSSSAAASNTSSSSTAASSGNSGNGISGQPAAETLKMMAQQHQHPPSQGQGPPYPHGGGDQPQPPPGPMTTPNTSLPNTYQPPHSAMPSGAPMSSMAPSVSGPNMSSMDSTANSQNMQQPMQPQRPAEADPRLRAAVSQRFRLGNPNSIANSMAGGVAGGGAGGQNPGMNSHPSMMTSHQQRMPMGNPGNMMANMPGNQQGGMGPSMQMMNQQQVQTTILACGKYLF